ncbi:MAG: hypothetical protein IIA01_07585 [Proteobacteria bacterium]|nr:hypothetical protein [Pseudomonadota bacterium]
MSWSRRRVLGHALVAAAASLSGCGFRPMYARRGRSGNVVDDLAAIRIDPVADRIGQSLRNDLIERLTPFGEPRYPRYRLSVQVQRSSQPLAIQADTTITRYNLRIEVSFTLTDVETGAAIYRGSARTVGSYNAVRSDFATLSAEQDTSRRAVREASDEVRTLLSVFFSRRRQAAG